MSSDDHSRAIGKISRGAKHPGFQAVATQVSAKEGVSKDRAAAIVAAGARKASAGAVKKNPALAKVKR